ncbi:hypothetical protein HK103_003486 [Boothiomyces macroporosus]|uniref:Uncharacterized protein n=1 Tax=Boothiomyces macroporosus TaxID=261099 RepID=A0AAD5UCC6_9FUNG|nr:hypothetical protein HK103_003486 [Boothiomyces macroporosus]
MAPRVPSPSFEMAQRVPSPSFDLAPRVPTPPYAYNQQSSTVYSSQPNITSYSSLFQSPYSPSAKPTELVYISPQMYNNIPTTILSTDTYSTEQYSTNSLSKIPPPLLINQPTVSVQESNTLQRETQPPIIEESPISESASTPVEDAQQINDNSLSRQPPLIIKE